MNERDKNFNFPATFSIKQTMKITMYETKLPLNFTYLRRTFSQIHKTKLQQSVSSTSELVLILNSEPANPFIMLKVKPPFHHFFFLCSVDIEVIEEVDLLLTSFGGCWNHLLSNESR